MSVWFTAAPCLVKKIKKKKKTETKINIEKIKLMKISPGNSDENVPNKMFQVSVLLVLEVLLS